MDRELEDTQHMPREEQTKEIEEKNIGAVSAVIAVLAVLENRNNRRNRNNRLRYFIHSLTVFSVRNMLYFIAINAFL